ncbi:MAG TPA: YciI family protein [Thermoanaerobaculia bacterium]|nr:YciI family protein [Thermoanaerobaculia bacterium]
MKYLCLAYGDQEKTEAMPKSEWNALIEEIGAYDQELKQTGKLVSGTSLGWAATTLQMRNGKLSITDGPFAATKEVVGGLVVIEARDLNEAIQVASLHPAARTGENIGWAVEVRPIEEFPICKPDPSKAAAE